MDVSHAFRFSAARSIEPARPHPAGLRHEHLPPRPARPRRPTPAALHRLEPGGREPAGLPRRPPHRILLHAFGAPGDLDCATATARPAARSRAPPTGEPRAGPRTASRSSSTAGRPGDRTPTSSPSTCAPLPSGAITTRTPTTWCRASPATDGPSTSPRTAPGTGRSFAPRCGAVTRSRSRTKAGSPPSRPRAARPSSTRGSTPRASSGWPSGGGASSVAGPAPVLGPLGRGPGRRLPPRFPRGAEDPAGVRGLRRRNAPGAR